MIWNSHLCQCFCFYQLGLCSVSFTANEYSIYHFCIMIKDLSISFSRVIIVQEPVHMFPGQLIATGQLTNPGVNFASVHGLTPVTVHMNFSLPRGNFERRVTHCTTSVNPPCQGNFSPCEQNAKIAPGQEQSCACSLLMFGINFPIKSSRKHEK